MSHWLVFDRQFKLVKNDCTLLTTVRRY